MFLNAIAVGVKNWKKKTIMFSYAEDIINAKLDIINYLKSILLLDIIKNITKDDKKEC